MKMNAFNLLQRLSPSHIKHSLKHFFGVRPYPFDACQMRVMKWLLSDFCIIGLNPGGVSNNHLEPGTCRRPLPKPP